MGESMTNNKSGGLLSNFLSQSPFAGLGLTPQMGDREVSIEFNEDQLKSMLTKDVDARYKELVTIELHEGRMVLKIRLW
jgi:hypothetical protein